MFDSCRVYLVFSFLGADPIIPAAKEVKQRGKCWIPLAHIKNSCKYKVLEIHLSQILVFLPPHPKLKLLLFRKNTSGS